MQQMGAAIEDRLTKSVTHVFAMNSDSLLRQIDADRLSRFQGVSFYLGFKFLNLYCTSYVVEIRNFLQGVSFLFAKLEFCNFFFNCEFYSILYFIA